MRLPLLSTILIAAACTQLEAREGSDAHPLKDGPFLAWPGGDDVGDPDMSVGWGFVYEWANPFSVEFDGLRMQDVIGGDDFGTAGFPSGADVDLELYVFSLSGRVGWDPVSFIRLYGSAGIGFYWIDSEAENIRKALDRSPETGPNGFPVRNANIDIDKDFGYHLAAGLEFLLTDFLELFVEYRKATFETEAVIKIDEQIPGAWALDDTRTTRRTETFTYDHDMVRAGINFRF